MAEPSALPVGLRANAAHRRLRAASAWWPAPHARCGPRTWALMVFGALLTAPSLGRAEDIAAAQSQAAAAAHAYESADYAKAVEGFRAAIAAGLDHASIHYNLGNAYFKSGQLGHSIASYLRAVRRAPRDRAARTNLSRAQSLTQDEALRPLSVPVFLRPLAWVYRGLSLNEWLALFLAALFILSAVGILAQWGVVASSHRRTVGWGAVTVAALALGMAAVHYRGEVLRTTAVVVANEVDVRSGPGQEYNLAFKIHEGLAVAISEQRGEWVQIDLGGALVGWVPSDRLERV